MLHIHMLKKIKMHKTYKSYVYIRLNRVTQVFWFRDELGAAPGVHQLLQLKL